MNLVFLLYEDGSEIEMKHCASLLRQALSRHENIRALKLDKTRYQVDSIALNLVFYIYEDGSEIVLV